MAEVTESGKRSFSETTDVFHKSADESTGSILSPSEMTSDPTPDSPRGSTPFVKRKKSINAILPEVFQMDQLTHDQRLAAYLSIFSNCPPNLVMASFTECLAENVKLTDWTAVWRSQEFASYMLVHVEKAPVGDGFQAKINLAEPFAMDPGTSQPPTKGVIQTYLTLHEYLVPLVELCPVYDENGDLDDTALALEHLRFFMDNLWRLSDEEDEGHYSFLERNLIPRLRFFYQLENDLLPPDLSSQYRQIVEEYQAKRKKLTQIQSQLIDSDDENDDLDNSQVATEIMDLHQEVLSLETKLEHMENPALRNMVQFQKQGADRSLMNKSAAMKKLQKQLSESKPDTTTHLVGEKINVKMIEELGLPSEAVISTHLTVYSAITEAKDGDVILIFPGQYSGIGMDDIVTDLTFEGVGELGDVVISFDSLGSGFSVDCGKNVSLTNLKLFDKPCGFLASGFMNNTIEITSCILEGGGVAIVGRGGKLIMKDSTISGTLGYGVCMTTGASADIENSVIEKCGQGENKSDCGIIVEAAINDSDSPTQLKLTGNIFQNIRGPAIYITGEGDVGDKVLEGTLEDLQGVPGVHATLTDNVFRNNKGGDISIARSVLMEDSEID